MRMCGCAVMMCLGACVQIPALQDTATPGVATAAFPKLLPFEDVLTAPVARTSVDGIETVEGRAAALMARADRLRGPVVDAGTRARMQGGVSR